MYTAAQKAKYWADKAAEEGGSKPARKAAANRTAKGKRSGTVATRVGRRRTKKQGDYKKRSGCFYEESYTNKTTGEVVNRPRIWGWRIDKKLGFQSFVAYLDKNDGAPRNGTSTDVCRVFVVNITTKGLGESKATGVWSVRWRKLSITKLGLVANPFAANKGYFGRGGSQYADRVK